MATTPVTAWDANGNPVTPSATTAPTKAWDASGNPIAPAAPAKPTYALSDQLMDMTRAMAGQPATTPEKQKGGEAAQEAGFMAAGKDAALTLGGELAAPYVSKGWQAIEEPVSNFLSKVGDKFGALRDMVRYNPAPLHEAVQKAATNTTGGLVDASKIPARQAISAAADRVYAESKDMYKLIDDATEGKWSANEQAIRNANQAIQDTLGTKGEAGDAKLIAERARLLWQQEQMLDDMALHGVPAQVIDAAKANYKQSSALYDLDAAIKSSTELGKESSPGMKLSEKVNPTKLAPRLQKMFDSGRLQEALPNGEADNILSANDTARRALRTAKTVRRVAAGAATAEVARKVLGEPH